GETLMAWYAEAKPGQPTVLYFHGNGGTLADRTERLLGHVAARRGVLIMSYRGHSGSTGAPSEKHNVADALLAYRAIRELGVATEGLFLYGESIGSGVAVQVAAANPVAGIVMDAPYTSIVDVAEICYPKLPARLLMRDRYETLDRHLPKVSAPILVIHGEDDQVIPVEMGRKIAAAAPAGGEIVTFPGAGHTDHGQFGSFDVVDDWIRRVHTSGAGIKATGGGVENTAAPTKKAAV
ncbi:MAG: alpha/beta hydrolase, partial [Myxococcota bacterium]